MVRKVGVLILHDDLCISCLEMLHVPVGAAHAV